MTWAIGCTCNSRSESPCRACSAPDYAEQIDAAAEEKRLATPEPERECENCKIKAIKISVGVIDLDECDTCENSSNWR
jgi:hypothetical protein